jgi:hypothetical protein
MRVDAESLNCLHNAGPTGKVVGAGCTSKPQYECKLYGTCVLSVCASARGIKNCQDCGDFLNKYSPEAKTFVEDLKTINPELFEEYSERLES